MTLAVSGSPEAMPREHLEQLEAIDQRYWWHRVRWRAVRRSLKRFGGRNEFACYFDVGSGGGGLPGLLLRDFRFGEIHLFDQYEAGASKVSHPRLVQHRVDLERFSTEALPAPDLITCLDVLEHLRDPVQLLRALKRGAAGRESLLIVTVPAFSWLWSWWDERAGHHRRYTRRELCATLETGGWTVVASRYLFHAAILPLLLRRGSRGGPQQLMFPQLPGWLNRAVEWAFWIEYLASGWLRLPGSSLMAVAR